MKNSYPFPWKKTSLALSLGMLLFFASAAQCVNNLGTHSYDTLITGIGYGNYTIQFPKWNPDSGLLVSVKINAIVSVQYSFTLKNADTLNSTYSITVGQEDVISSPLMSSPYDNITEQRLGDFPLNPGVSLSQGPFSFLNNYINTDSITDNVGLFLGEGPVSFVYSPSTYTNVHSSNNASYSYRATAFDTTHFSITYLYCMNEGVLATDLTHFAAVAEDPETVLLSWDAVNEVDGRVYQIQRSNDGTEFVTVGSLPAMAGSMGTAEYRYEDHLSGPSLVLPVIGAASGKWYYRLQISDGGHLSYSAIREVTMGGSGNPGLMVYPNPAANFVNLVFGVAATGSGTGMNGSGTGVTTGDWQVELWSANGNLVYRNVYFKSLGIRIDFQHKLAAGTYFVRATNMRGAGDYVSSFVVVQ
jgi:hypothetical protein